MSLLMSEPKEQKFLARFENVWASLRRSQVRQGLALTFLVAALGLAALAAADFRWELPRRTRAVGLAAASALTLAVLAARVVVPLRWWTKPRTAVEIERRFPALGQRVRTLIQFGGLSAERVHSQGVAPGLVGALGDETEGQVEPLPLDAIIPWRRVWATAALAAVPALVLGFAAATSDEWRTAVERALLGGRAYTALAVTPGTIRVDQNDSVSIVVEMTGRPRREVVLQSKGVDRPDASWKAAEMEAPAAAGPGKPPRSRSRSRSRREATLEKVRDPLVYRVVAGPVTSPIFTIDVRYPLAVQSFEVALSPPGYTGVKPSTVKGGDLSVIEGTGAAFRIAFDGRPTEAAMVLIDPSGPAKKPGSPGTPPTRVIALKAEGPAFVTHMTLTKALVYRIEARTADGRVLPRNRYRIDVQEDRAPRVSFEEPDEALEVHPIAEVLNRVRVGDDFGLTRAGIVFRFNDGDEQTLVGKDFNATAGKGRRETSAALEETLLLEKLAASPADSVTYYAFAEDNYPAGARRTETDLRYIDVRPFQREYKKGEAGDDAPEGEGRSATLQELIARQRFNLNRGVRMARRKPNDKSPAEDPLKIAGFEENLATMVREFTEGVERIADQRVEPLHQAEEAMLAAVGAIDKGRNAEAPAQMANALRHLIEVRKTIEQIIGEADPKTAQALRSFDRTQVQKIRKPKGKEGEAEEIAERLEALAQEEDFVYATIAAAGAPGESPKVGTGEKGNEAEKDKTEAEPKAANAPENKAEAPKGQEGEKGDKGPKGSSKGSGTTSGEGLEGGKGEPDDKDKEEGPARKNDPRETMKKQEAIADEARALEERLKKLEVASDLAKARMAKAAETAGKAAGALARGNTKEAAEAAKAGAAMLHELARQVKGEVAREVAEELAMARDLAAELAEREAELAGMPDGTPPPGSGDPKGEPGKDAKGQGPNGSRGAGGDGPGGLTDAERLERLQEAARTLQEWLKGASLRAEGEAAVKVRELLEGDPVAKVAERMARVGELILGGQKPEARREAKEVSRKLEVLARELDVLHRGIVAPQLAALVEADARAADLTAKLKALKTDAEISEWHRQAVALVRDLEKAGMTQAAAALTDAMTAGGWTDGGAAWDWATGPHAVRVAPVNYGVALRNIANRLQDRVQDLILKGMASARDEATPPEFRDLVERYYEVLSRSGGPSR